MSTVQKRKITIELPAQAYNAITELAKHHGIENPDGLIYDYIFEGLEMHLLGETTTTQNIDSKLGKYIAKRNDYNPRAWRDEQ